MPEASTPTDPCIFCRIVRGEVPSSRIAGNEKVSAFLDISPVNPGHALVVPLRHTASFTDLTPEEVEAMMRTAREIAVALKASIHECEGVTLSMADGEAAGQEVPHAHLHVIPRHAGDGFGWKRLGQSIGRGELEAIANRIRQALEIT